MPRQCVRAASAGHSGEGFAVPRHSIVVGIDGSAPSEAALGWAAHEAFLRGVGLYLIHAFPWAPPVFSPIPVVPRTGRTLSG
ncbi:universal stress protein [Actinoallomurus sp. NPDC050550]|uniref:universal stress protein n=1 Tax=Actinoallomurus sp. NPDC050550 TaxID=3154937 RepID=UPI00340B1D41